MHNTIKNSRFTFGCKCSVSGFHFVGCFIHQTVFFVRMYVLVGFFCVLRVSYLVHIFTALVIFFSCFFRSLQKMRKTAIKSVNSLIYYQLDWLLRMYESPVVMFFSPDHFFRCYSWMFVAQQFPRFGSLLHFEHPSEGFLFVLPHRYGGEKLFKVW